MITSKQKAKDLIKVAESVMNLDRAIKEMRETTRLLVKELVAIDEPILKGQDDDIISLSQKVDEWYDKSYKSIFIASEQNLGDIRYLTMNLKYLNQIKDDIDKLYKGDTTFEIESFKLRYNSKFMYPCYEYTLKHKLCSENVIYKIYDEEDNPLVDACKIIDKNTILIRNNEKCGLKIVFQGNKFSGR